MHDVSYQTILQNKELLPEFEKKGLNAIYVEKLDTHQIDLLKLRTSELVIILTETKYLSLKLARYIKNELNHSKIIMRRQSAAHDLIVPGSDIKIVDHDQVIAHHIETMIARPDSLGILEESFGVFKVEEITVTKKEVHRKMVKEMAFPPSGSLVIQRRNNEIFIPHGNTHLLAGDIITVIGNTAALKAFRNELQ